MASKILVDPSDLSCSICIEVFNDPRALPCLHSYCYGCLEGWVKKSKSNKLSAALYVRKYPPYHLAAEQAKISSKQLQHILKQTTTMIKLLDQQIDDSNKYDKQSTTDIKDIKGPVTLGYGWTRSHAEGAKASHRESASVSVGKRL